MSENATQLISAFSALSPKERYAVFIELARIAEADAGPVSDEELTMSGAQIFSIYDAEEAGSGETETR